MIIALLLLAYFIFVTIPAAPLSAVILPVLLAGMYLSLSRNQQVEEGKPCSTAHPVRSADGAIRPVCAAADRPGVLRAGVPAGTALAHELGGLPGHDACRVRRC